MYGRSDDLLNFWDEATLLAKAGACLNCRVPHPSAQQRVSEAGCRS